MALKARTTQLSCMQLLQIITYLFQGRHVLDRTFEAEDRGISRKHVDTFTCLRPTVITIHSHTHVGEQKSQSQAKEQLSLLS